MCFLLHGFPFDISRPSYSQVPDSQFCTMSAVSTASPEGSRGCCKERKCNFLSLRMVYIFSRPPMFHGSPGAAPNLPFPNHSNRLMARQASPFFLNRPFLFPFSDIVSRASSPQGEIKQGMETRWVLSNPPKH